MEPLRPEWLNETLISTALGEPKQIINISTKPAVSFGENYMSVILRAEVTYKNKNSDDKTQNTSLILKTLPTGNLKEFVLENGMLTKELQMYSYVIPNISEILGKHVAPKSFKSCNEDVLILEDLGLQNYKTCDRVNGLDYKHCLIAMKLLADFHAASVTINKTQPHIIDKVRKEIHYTEENKYQKLFVLNNFSYVVEELKTWSGYEKYSSKLHATSENTWNKAVKEIQPNEDEIMVLNHGDFWTNNILFRYDEKNEIIDAKMIDFQFSRWTSPAIDLHIFFTISLREKEHMSSLLDVYLSQLNKHIHPQHISKEQLLKSLHRTECFSLILSVCILPMLLLDPLEANEIKENYATACERVYDNPVCRIACKGNNFRSAFPDILKHFEDIGLL